MKHDIFLKKYISFILAVLTAVSVSAACLPVNGEEELYGKVLRLHVIANSDSEIDQRLKLSVRDAVLARLEEIYKEAEVCDLDSAVRAAGENLAALEQTAEETLRANGSSYKVRAELKKDFYMTKKYENVSLPAGEYMSLQIKIGEADGKNWWGLLFPELCFASAGVCESGSKQVNGQDADERSEDNCGTYVYENENREKFIAAGFTADEIRIITDSDSSDVKVKFRVLEIIGQIFSHGE